MNSRLDTIQAVVLKNKLKSILKLNDIRRKISIFYDYHLKNIKEIKITNTDLIDAVDKVRPQKKEAPIPQAIK
jgi:dTDP-4-amino-4,6-dideoxygalactose transaminase